MPAGGENFLDWSPQEAYCYHILPRNVGVISHIIPDMHCVILLNGAGILRWLGYILSIEVSIKTWLLVRWERWGPGPLQEHEIEIKCKSIHLLGSPGGKTLYSQIFLVIFQPRNVNYDHWEPGLYNSRALNNSWDPKLIESLRFPRHYSLSSVYHNIGPLMLQLIESGPSAKIGGVIIFKFMSAVNLL